MEQETTDNRIRVATPEDARQIAEVHVRSWQSSYRGIISDDYLQGLDIAKRAERWSRILTEPGQVTLVGERRDGRIVGFCNAGPNRDQSTKFLGEVYSIYLLEDAKRRGLGRALFLAATSWIAQHLGASFLVWVLADNVFARRFYEKLGGQVVAEKSDSVGGATRLEVAYAWRCPPS